MYDAPLTASVSLRKLVVSHSRYIALSPVASSLVRPRRTIVLYRACPGLRSLTALTMQSEVHVELNRHGATSFDADMKVVEDAMAAWRAKWNAEIKSQSACAGLELICRHARV